MSTRSAVGSPRGEASLTHREQSAKGPRIVVRRVKSLSLLKTPSSAQSLTFPRFGEFSESMFSHSAAARDLSCLGTTPKPLSSSPVRRPASRVPVLGEAVRGALHHPERSPDVANPFVVGDRASIWDTCPGVLFQLGFTRVYRGLDERPFFYKWG